MNSLKSQISLHPQIGGSLNTIEFFEGEREFFKYLPGFQGGVGVDFKVGDLVSIEPVLRYNQKGYATLLEFEYMPGKNLTEKLSLRLHYIDLPIWVNFNTEFDQFNLVYSVGPYVGYCIAGRQILEYSDGTQTQILDSKNDENFMNSLVANEFNRFDFGMNLGIRAEVSNFTLGLVGSLSAQNLFGPMLQDNNKHLNFQLNVGYKIELE